MDGAPATVEPVLLGQHLDNPSGVPESENLPRVCAARMASDLATIHPRHLRNVEDSEKMERFGQFPCLSAMLYLLCAEYHIHEHAQRVTQDVRWNVAEALLHLRGVAAKRCEPDGLTMSVEGVLEAVRRLHAN